MVSAIDQFSFPLTVEKEASQVIKWQDLCVVVPEQLRHQLESKSGMSLFVANGMLLM